MLDEDAATGATSANQTWAEFEGRPLDVITSPVESDGILPATVMVSGSPWMNINGLAVCRQGDVDGNAVPGNATGLWFSIS